MPAPTHRVGWIGLTIPLAPSTPRGSDRALRPPEADPLQSPDELRRENEALRRRAARLGAAVRRIGASLDAAGALARRDGRSRAELAGTVGRQLLIPLTSIKGSTATALDAAADLDAGGMLQLFRIIDERAEHMADLIGGGAEAGGSRIGTASTAEDGGRASPLAPPAADGHAADNRGGASPLAPQAADQPANDGGRATGGPAAVRQVGPAGPTASVQAAPRRPAGPEPFRLGDLAVDHELRRVTVAGRRVDLTATEYELLRALSAHPGRVSTVDELLRRVWGKRHAGDLNLLRAFVNRLRGKLGDDAARPAYIFTERGVGYRLADPGDGYRLAAPRDGYRLAAPGDGPR